MSFTFNDTIPAAAHNPSNDQDIMLKNNIADAQIWAVDHIGFNALNGGTHKFTHFTKNVIGDNVPGAVANPSSVAYTAAGVGDATRPQYYFKTDLNTLPISLIRAYAHCSNTGAILLSQSFNVTSAVVVSATVTVTLTANAVTGTSYGVLVTGGLGVASTVTYNAVTINSATVFTINFVPAMPATFTFVVFQL